MFSFNIKFMKIALTAKTRLNLEFFLVSILLLFSFGFTLYQNLTINHRHHYGLLAKSYLELRTDIQEGGDRYLDTIKGRDGRYYYINDPLPGVLMMPFVLLGGALVSQGYLDFLVTLTSAFLVWKILGRKVKLTLKLWLILIFFFASNMVSVIWSPHPWFLAQNIAVMWVLWLIYEWQNKKRTAVLFIALLMLVLTKKMMILPIAAYFFLDSLIFPEEIWKRVRRLGFMTCAVIAGILILWNYQRIGVEEKVLLNFYNYAHVESTLVEKVKKYGFWSTAYFPTNFVNYFLAGPVIVREETANPYGDLSRQIAPPYLYPPLEGISFFFLGPVFLSLIFLPLPGFKKTLPILGAFLVWAGTYLTYNASGAVQFGSRYGAEAVPYLFLLLIYALSTNFTYRAKIVVIGSIFMNMFLFRQLLSFFMNP